MNDRKTLRYLASLPPEVPQCTCRVYDIDDDCHYVKILAAEGKAFKNPITNEWHLLTEKYRNKYQCGDYS